MVRPHCGNDTDASTVVHRVTLINNAGAAQPAIYPVVNVANANALNYPWTHTVCAAANGCNPFPLVTYIKF